MPLATSSAFAPTKEILVEAHRLANMDPHDPDPDLDLCAPGKSRKWTTHSLRRLADTVARRYREVTGTTADEIDIYFGWHERVLLRAMQMHYAAMSIPADDGAHGPCSHQPSHHTCRDASVAVGC